VIGITDENMRLFTGKNPASRRPDRTHYRETAQ
jgi:hypothetical protein